MTHKSSLRIIVASQNPVKIEAARSAFTHVWPSKVFVASGKNAPSGVSSQPMSDEETKHGAMGRLKHIRGKYPSDYWVAIEGGIVEIEDHYMATAWIAIQNSQGQIGLARAGTFQLPDQVIELILRGIELGIANDQVFGKHNSKQDQGAIGLLTHSLINRTDLYHHGLILALIPFLKSTTSQSKQLLFGKPGNK